MAKKKINNKQYNEAYHDLRDSYSLYDRNDEVWMYIGFILLLGKHYESALLQFTRTLEINPNFAICYFYKSIIFLEQGNKEDAISNLEKSEQLGYAPAKEKLNELRQRSFFSKWWKFK